MRFDPHLAEFRFGYSLSPVLPAPQSAADMLDLLAGPDLMARAYPITPFEEIRQRMQALRELNAARRDSPTKQAAEIAYEASRRIADRTRGDQLIWLNRHLARRSWTRDAFRERLVAFWADHFTARGKSIPTKWAMSPYVESAIRPHVTGRFAALLASAVKAPQMILYLDQQASLGPGSRRARRTPRDDGLNENLARELLELHTLGVAGPYAQNDVRQLAELLTGMTFVPQEGTVFRKGRVEPGPETVLGRTYGGGPPTMADIDAVLADLAVHPATAAHLARKLAVHFVSDAPDPGLVAALEARFAETGGDLMALYEVLLTHPAAWDPAPGNLRPPLDWVSAVARALAMPADHLPASPAGKRFLKQLPRALARMGQPYEEPAGPDGWPEEDAFWLTPQGIAVRLQWALSAPRHLGPGLPDPRDFVESALGPRADSRLRFAAAAAESRADGVGLILASPEFQRS